MGPIARRHPHQALHLFYKKMYVHWVKRYILFNKKRHPAEMSAPEIDSFLSHLA
jgi:hypothetical protein